MIYNTFRELLEDVNEDTKKTLFNLSETHILEVSLSKEYAAYLNELLWSISTNGNKHTIYDKEDKVLLKDVSTKKVIALINAELG